MSTIPEFAIYCGDCRDILPTFPTLADACICDPPYGLKFMGKGWDHGVPGPDFWKAVLDACKPGAHLLAFGGSRTFHRLACAIEDAGWEMRDCLMWVYGSGFPKSLDVSKAIDKRGGNSHLTAEIGAAIKSARLSRGVSIKDADSRYCQGSTLWTWYEGRPAGQQLPTAEVMAAIARDWPELQRHAELIAEAEREVVGIQTGTVLAVAPGQGSARSATTMDITAPATDAAKQWQGWGTALKPAHEPIVVGYRPLTAEQFVALLTEKIRFQLCQLLSVSDAEKALNASPAKSSEVAHSVPELARTYELANSGNVRFVAKRFTCTKAALNAATVDSVQENAKASGNQTFARETAIPLGMVDDFLIQLMATSTSGTMADISVNTVSSWLEISDALLNAASTFTIETGIRLTIALRTLSLFLSQTISSDTGSLSLDASPNCQPIILARKPLDGTVAANVQKHGTGALNIDACRIPTNPAQDDPRLGGEGDWRTDKTAKNVYEGGYVGTRIASSPLGRWPANLILTIPEDNYILREDVTIEQKRKLYQWLQENS
jgi:hypothetical protein